MSFSVSIFRLDVVAYMNLMGLQAIFPKKKKNVSLQDKSHKIYPYLITHYC